MNIREEDIDIGDPRETDVDVVMRFSAGRLADEVRQRGEEDADAVSYRDPRRRLRERAQTWD